MALPATRDPLFTDAGGAIQPRPRHSATVSAGDPGLQPYPSRRDEVALAVGDLDGDGLEDFVFGGSGGEPSRAYFQQTDGTFRAAAIDSRTRGSDDAVEAAIFDAHGDGWADIPPC